MWCFAVAHQDASFRNTRRFALGPCPASSSKPVSRSMISFATCKAERQGELRNCEVHVMLEDPSNGLSPRPPVANS